MVANVGSRSRQLTERSIRGQWIGLAAGMSVLLTGSAQAQTDDLILNDVVSMLASIAEYEEMATLCAAATGNDPAVVAGFQRFHERGSSWIIILVTTIGAREEQLDPALIAEARENDVRGVRYRIENDADAAKTCRDFVSFSDTFESDITTYNVEESARILEARDGKRPPIDVDASQEVADAMAVESFHETTEAMLLACAFGGGRNEEYAAAYSDWSSRNFMDDLTAGSVRIMWGARAPWRDELISKLAETTVMAEVRLSPDRAEHCAAFVESVKAGNEDIAARFPEEIARLRVAHESDGP